MVPTLLNTNHPHAGKGGFVKIKSHTPLVSNVV